jgi:FkbM family methyltransferase
MHGTGPGVIHFVDWDYCYIPEIFTEIYLQKIYLPYLIGKKDATFLDLGCNIGLWSLYASPFAKQIYSFEPALSINETAQKNLKDNNITNVKLFQKAIAAEDEKTTFYHSTNKTMYSLHPIVNNNGEKEEVETIRLDTLVKQEGITHIDFAKIDIEGTEDKLFTSESFKNIVPMLDAFVYEWHRWANANPFVINAGLQKLGYVTRQIPSQATLFIAQKK